MLYLVLLIGPMFTYLQVLQDKKLKGQLAFREELQGQSAKTAAKAQKVCFPIDFFFLLMFVSSQIQGSD